MSAAEIGKMINLALAGLVILFAFFLYRKYHLWIDALMGLAGVGWFGYYIFLILYPPPPEVYLMVGNNYTRYLVSLTLLTMAVGLIVRGRDH